MTYLTVGARKDLCRAGGHGQSILINERGVLVIIDMSQRSKLWIEGFYFITNSLQKESLYS
jgi:hypothetical protein